MSDIVNRLHREKINQMLGHPSSKKAVAELLHDAAIALSEAQQREKDARREGWAFAEGDIVRKKSGSWWEGRVVGTYSTEQTPRGYAVQLDKPNGPVQIYPESALVAMQSEER